jgi:GAF domain-containing protein
MDELQVTLERLREAALGQEIQSALDQVVNSSTTLFGVAGCGVMFADGDHVLHYVAASDEEGRKLEHAQADVGRGPCVDALVHDSVVATRDVTADERWPLLHGPLGETRVRAVLGMPVHLAGAAVGSLNAYREHAHDWREAEAAGLAAYAQLIESLLVVALHASHHERLARQLQHALDHRVVIERAVGVLMARRGLDAVTAFDALRRHARERRRRVADVAEEVLREGDLSG